ncbi:MAG: cytochrome c biogenesis protein ResB [Thermoguttaceae bacterium]|nr:cytochrome c biogenesis protein ResB [Thermoguttaceae bacterium]MDW8078298.1 hypothetical protein [Thermoguttaceae bacterium]
MAGGSPGSSSRLTKGGLLWQLVCFLASLRVAVVLLTICALVLAAATFLEWRWGTEAAHYLIYQAWWFHLLIVLLSLSVLFSALVRFPWKRHHVGFLITHFGILVLLVGALLGLWFGVDAQLPVFEGQTAHRAFAQESQFVLTISPWARGSETGDVRSIVNSGGAGDNSPQGKIIRIPFRPGPFHWDSYSSWGIWLLGQLTPSRGVLYDDGNIRLEVLDYYRDADVVPAPALRLGVRKKDGSWEQRSFRAGHLTHSGMPHRSFAVGARQELPGGQRIVFWVASSRAEGEAFLKVLPNGELPPGGQLVLFHRGAVFRASVDELEAKGQAIFDLAKLRIRLSQVNQRFHGAVVDLEPLQAVGKAGQPASQSRRVILFADLVEFNRHDDYYGVYGAYWHDGAKAAEAVDSPSGQSASQETGTGEASPRPSGLSRPDRPRVDILQTVDGTLLYRACAKGKVLQSGVLPIDRTPVRLFAGLPEEFEIRVENWAPMDRPGELLRPLPLQSGSSRNFKQPFARVRLSVDNWSEEFWLEEQPASPFMEEEAEQYRRWVAGQGRSVAVDLVPRMFELGFVVRLHEFERRLEPGSKIPASYASRVDVIDRRDTGRVLVRDWWISMNRPLTVRDPATGYVYRLYQESYRGPFTPGDPLFERVVHGGEARQQLYLSWLAVSYDPGRGLKYLGSLLTVVGIIITFYMRGYFRSGGATQEERSMSAAVTPR